MFNNFNFIFKNQYIIYLVILIILLFIAFLIYFLIKKPTSKKVNNTNVSSSIGGSPKTDSSLAPISNSGKPITVPTTAPTPAPTQAPTPVPTLPPRKPTDPTGPVILYQNSDKSGQVQKISRLGAFLSSQAATKFNDPTSEFDGNVSFISIPAGLTVDITDLPNSSNNNKQKVKKVQGPKDIDIVALGLSVPLWSIVITNDSIPSPIPTNISAVYNNATRSVTISWTPPDVSQYNRSSISYYNIYFTYKSLRLDPPYQHKVLEVTFIPGTSTNKTIQLENYPEQFVIRTIIPFSPNGRSDTSYLPVSGGPPYKYCDWSGQQNSASAPQCPPNSSDAALSLNANGIGNNGIGRCHVNNVTTAANNCVNDPLCDSVIHDKFGYEPRNQNRQLKEPDSGANYLYILNTNRPCTVDW
jgi:hypothetical protein